MPPTALPPIKNQEHLDLVEKELLKYSPCFSLAFRLLYETGFSLDDIIALKVKDVIGKEVLTYNEKATRGISYTVTLSDQTRQMIDHVCELRTLDDCLLYKRGQLNMPISRSYFMQALYASAENKGLTGFSLTSLHKTFLYREYLRTKDIAYIRKLSKKDSMKNAAIYLDIYDEIEWSDKKCSDEPVFYPAEPLLKEIDALVNELHQIKSHISSDSLPAEPYERMVQVLHLLHTNISTLGNIDIKVKL